MLEEKGSCKVQSSCGNGEVILVMTAGVSGLTETQQLPSVAAASLQVLTGRRAVRDYINPLPFENARVL